MKELMIKEISSLVTATFLMLPCMALQGQVLPASRATDWTGAGLSSPPVYPVEVINILDFNADSTGVQPCDAAFSAAKSGITGLAILYFPSGTFRFESTLILPDSLILQGAGAESTFLQFDLGGSGNLISATGSLTGTSTAVIEDGEAGQAFIRVSSTSGWQIGDVARLSKDDQDLVNDSWAFNTVAQIVKITGINNDTFMLDQPLRTSFPIVRNPVLAKIIPRRRVGIECLSIKRLDVTTTQSKNIHFQYAVDCWVKGVESDFCNFGHLVLDWCSHIEVSNSYFHHAFDYGGGGKAYGLVLESASNLNLIQNNIFEHLRHSMLLQSGANGNVVALNYSTDPSWTEFPQNAAGDIVCHGNYPFMNLFDHNIVQNIVIDNSHGANGPYNTFFRNRAELYGLIMTASSSPSQNFIGNEITNNFLGNYILMGNDHFEYGNNQKGTIQPPGTGNLSDISYYYLEHPSFLPESLPLIGPPDILNSNSIPARDRFIAGVNLTPCDIGCDRAYVSWTVWSGCGDSADWFDPDNWHQAIVPLVTDAVYIPKTPAGGDHFPVINSNAIIKYLWVAPGAKFETLPGAQLTVTK
jgi:hypothetical protein